MSKSKRAATRFHLTALDIHPAVIARNLVSLHLINELVDNQTITPETKTEVIATYMYAFVGVVMPDYCHKRWAHVITPQPPFDLITIFRLMAILENLRDSLSENPLRLPSWIFVPTNSIPPVLGAINYWIDTAKTTKTKKVLELHEFPDHSAPTSLGAGMPGPMFPLPGSLAEYGDKLIRELSASSLEGMTGQQLVQTGLMPDYISPSQARQYFERHKSELVEVMVERMKTTFPSANTDIEIKWYTMTKTISVPRELAAKHSVLKQLSAAVKQDRNIPRTLIDKVAPSRHCSVSEGSLDHV